MPGRLRRPLTRRDDRRHVETSGGATPVRRSAGLTTGRLLYQPEVVLQLTVETCPAHTVRLPVTGLDMTASAGVSQGHDPPSFKLCWPQYENHSNIFDEFRVKRMRKIRQPGAALVVANAEVGRHEPDAVVAEAARIDIRARPSASGSIRSQRRFSPTLQ